MERNDEQEKKRQGDIHSVSLNMDCIGTTIKGTEGAMWEPSRVREKVSHSDSLFWHSELIEIIGIIYQKFF